MKYVFRKKRNHLFVTLFDAAGYFLALILGKQKLRLSGKFEPKTLLVIRMDHLGDVLMATGIPKLIKENYASCRVIFLTSSWAAPLLDNNPFVDEVLVYDAPWFSKNRYRRRPKGYSFFGVIQALREKKIEAAVGLRGDLRENILMAFAGIKRRFGYGVTGGGFLLTDEVAYRKLAHESERTSELLKAMGIRAVLLEPQIYFSKTEEDSFEEAAGKLGMGLTQPSIGFQIDAGAEAKEWPVSHMRSFLEVFGDRHPEVQIILVGSDAKKGAFLAEGHPQRLNAAGRTNLRDLCLILKKFSVFIGHDSGPTHIAAALGVPTIFLYSGTNRFEEWKPLFEIATVLRYPVSCSPCHLDVCNVKGHPCMTEIRPLEVLRAVETELR